MADDWAGKRSLAFVIVFAVLVLTVTASTSTARSAHTITVLAVDDTPLVSPGVGFYGPTNTIGMALMAADGGAGQERAEILHAWNYVRADSYRR